MGGFRLTCCSTADMSASFFEEKDIPFAKFHFTMDGENYLDDLGKTIPFETFYERMSQGATPTTAQVNPNEYAKLFTPILEAGEDILHIALSSGLSGSYGSAVIAGDMLQMLYPARRVMVIDSLAASSGYGLLVNLAAQMRAAKHTLDEVSGWVEANKLRIHHWFFSTDLGSYFRGGRISRAEALFGNALHICPLLNMDHEGRLIPRSKHRGKKSVMKAIVDKMELHAKNGMDYNGKCFISHSACYEDAEIVAGMVEERFPKLDGKVLINSIGTTIGSHTGPGTVALFFVGDTRLD